MQNLVSFLQYCSLAMAVTRRNILVITAVCLGVLAILTALYQPSSVSEERIELHFNSNYSHQDMKNELSTVKENVQKCFGASKLGSTDPGLVQLAIDNAQLFLKEYRTVIPRVSLEKHSSHCWRMNYSVSTTALSKVTGRVTGHLDKHNFDRRLDWDFYGASQFSDLNSHYNGQFSSDTVCLPKTYLLGFEKCGSTYLWCFVSKVLHAFSNNSPGKSSDNYHADKEPYFWTPFHYTKSLPSADTISGFLINFLQAADPTVSSEERQRVMLIDGTPSTVIEWPDFRETDPQLANYCLLPSTLPQLFPDSKYVVVMRDPLDMLYSNFWWTFYVDWKISPSFLKDLYYHEEGPKVFHDNSVSKIDAFLECLRDESQAPCPFTEASVADYSSCIIARTHLLSQCVHEITNQRTRKESAIHRAIYYVHVRKWLSILPRDRILFVTLDKIKKEPAEVASKVLSFFEIDDERNGLPLTDQSVQAVTTTCSKNSKGLIDYKQNPKIKNMLQETEVILKKFLTPFNRLLADLLDNDEFLWQS